MASPAARFVGRLRFEASTNNDAPFNYEFQSVFYDHFAPKDVEELEEIGNGAYGQVHRVVLSRPGEDPQRVTRHEMARKTIRVVRNTNPDRIRMELNVLRGCNTEHITAFYGSYSNLHFVCIFTELMDLSLKDLLKIAGFLPEHHLQWVATNVLRGVQYLKMELKVLHRDLKPENILANRQGQVKLCDMGVSGTLENSLAKSNVGSPMYMSPERLNGQEYSVLAEIWSIGITLTQLAMGQAPYPPPTEKELSHLIRKMEAYRAENWSVLAKLATVDLQTESVDFFQLVYMVATEPSPKLPDFFGSDLRDFVALCLDKEPSKRAAIQQLLQHAFLANAQRSPDTFRTEFSGFVDKVLEMKKAKVSSPGQKPSESSCCVM